MKASSPVLIDLLSADSFAEEHLPGAENFCVYETAFIEKVRAAFPDPNVEMTVYGLNDLTKEAGEAVSKLNAAGYANVSVLPGGLEGWKTAGKATQGSNHPTRPLNGRFEVDLAASFVQWTGRNLFNHHTGTLQLGKGHLLIEEGLLIEAVLTIDMTSLRCSDLTDSALNAALIAHLRSDDFFSIDRHPQAKFVLTSSEPLPGATVGTPNYRFRGDFTVRGKTQPIILSASVAEKSSGVLVAQSILEIDRTLWDSIYGSGKFFGRLGQHVVNDFIQIQLKVVTFPG